MSYTNDSNDNLNDVNSEINFTEEFFKYLSFWKVFAVSLILCLLTAFLYIRYTPKVYNSVAKIQVLDKSETSLEMPSASDLFSRSKINLENEVEVMLSYPILQEVVRNLNLTTSIVSIGDIVEVRSLEYPFEFHSNLLIDSIKKSEKFRINLLDEGLEIIDYQSNEKKYLFKDFTTKKTSHNLPFEIYKINKDKWTEEGYYINFNSLSKMVANLKKEISINLVGKESEIVSLSHNSTLPKYSEKIINELINVFNDDGIKDRQLIHKRTIDFVDDRYLYLSLELDSIEIMKELFKKNNNLVDFEVNSVISLEQSSKSEESIFSLENKISIVNLLLDVISNKSYELLPSNIGVDNSEINNLILKYNETLISREKLFLSAGSNNPSLIQLDKTIDNSRLNIIFSLQTHLSQLNNLKDQLLKKINKFDSKISNLPENEKILRAIERNQKIKETLYLFLLQKREEAQVSYAVTEPSIKVVEYAILNSQPISPKTNMIFIGALFLGLFIPFIFLYFTFLYDTKIYSSNDLKKFNFNIVGEIPFFDLSEKEKIFTNPDDRSVISESFRMLMSNIRYLEKNDSKSNVILVTSSIKGEGKTLNSLNLALSFSSIGKNVLIIGADLRNPQLHKYIDIDKSTPGLSDYLVNNKILWKKNIINPFPDQSLDVLLSGPLPPNPLNLINNGNIDTLINEAKKTYDYIIIDSAPTLLVADTKSLFSKSDVLIYLTRCNVTDVDILKHISDVSSEVDANVGVILNGIGEKSSYGYAYGYKYGYGYNYKYQYNYGYGYGYSSDDAKES